MKKIRHAIAILATIVVVPGILAQEDQHRVMSAQEYQEALSRVFSWEKFQSRDSQATIVVVVAPDDGPERAVVLVRLAKGAVAHVLKPAGGSIYNAINEELRSNPNTDPTLAGRKVSIKETSRRITDGEFDRIQAELIHLIPTVLTAMDRNFAAVKGHEEVQVLLHGAIYQISYIQGTEQVNIRMYDTNPASASRNFEFTAWASKILVDFD